MKIAFVLFKYFPYGGLQRDMVRIAEACERQGHDIHVYTLQAEGTLPAGFHVHVVPVRRLTNHGRYEAFHRKIQPLFRQHGIEGIVGFNRMPNLDIYYAADPFFKRSRLKGQEWRYRLLGRYRHFMAFERAVFGTDSRTEILAISEPEMERYILRYNTPRQRFHLLPPGLGMDRPAPPDAPEQRARFRAEFGFGESDRLVLQVGSGFRMKGLDRSLRALASLPRQLRRRTRLFVIGQDNPGRFLRLAHRLGVEDSFRHFPGRDDVARFMLGADLLIHPAYFENTGTVILEAIVAGLPVLTTDACGYACHVSRAGAGRVLISPFRQADLNEALADMLCSPQRPLWSDNGIAYGRSQDLYRGPEVAASLIIELLGRKRG